jgi:hypothetical protein
VVGGLPGWVCTYAMCPAGVVQQQHQQHGGAGLQRLGRVLFSMGLCRVRNVSAEMC